MKPAPEVGGREEAKTVISGPLEPRSVGKQHQVAQIPSVGRGSGCDMNKNEKTVAQTTRVIRDHNQRHSPRNTVAKALLPAYKRR
jgi:hypothetical protein